MKGVERAAERLSFREKVCRLKTRLKDPEWRRYGKLLIAGKALGVLLTLAIMLVIAVGPSLLSGDVHAQATPTTAPAVPTAAAPAYPTVTAGDVVNPLNTVWTLVAAFLVFGMQVGFTMLEAGFCRSRETVNVLVECVFDTCLCGILFYAWGFAFMFGHGNGWIGWGDGAGQSWFFLGNVPATYEATGVAFLAFWIFQFAFADCASTICSGAMIGRTGFWGDILYSVAVSGFIYPIIGHWAWGPDGFLALMGTKDHFLPDFGMNFHDFAGSTVVHTIGGTIALAGAIALGPRLGRKFKRDGGGPMLPHDLTIALCGGLLLWFGWYGFNPGSTLSAMDIAGIGRVATNTTLAACAAGLTAIGFVYLRVKKWDAGAITNGFLAGLVAITCPCYWVSPAGSVILGAVAGVLAILATDALEYLRIDDPIGAVPVHMANGIWGTLSLGLFACGKYGITGPTGADNSTPLAGLFYGGGSKVLLAQCIGSATVTVATFAVALAVMYALKAIGVLRISPEGELEGMDLHEHGIPAYPEYVIAASAAPSGMSAESVHVPAPARTSSAKGIGIDLAAAGVE
jgi:Amt family ammonium transporter